MMLAPDCPGCGVTTAGAGQKNRHTLLVSDAELGDRRWVQATMAEPLLFFWARFGASDGTKDGQHT